MPRKTIGSSTPRKRKNGASAEAAAIQPLPVEVAPEVHENFTIADMKESTVNLDEEIRRRAYELYLQRNGAAGDPNRDWFIAEREVRSRYAGHQSGHAFAASQGRG